MGIEQLKSYKEWGETQRKLVQEMIDTGRYSGEDLVDLNYRIELLDEAIKNINEDIERYNEKHGIQSGSEG